MLSDFEGQVLTPTLEPVPPGMTAYAVCREGRTQVLLVNRSEIEVSVGLEPAPGAPVTYTLLNDASFEATGAPKPAPPRPIRRYCSPDAR